MKKSFIVLLAGVCITASAQGYRMVNGQIYRADDPSVWRVFNDLQIVGVMPDGSLTVREVFQNTGSSVVADGKGYGAQSWSYCTYGQAFVLIHYRSYQAPCPGMDIGCVRAMLVPPATLTDGQRDVTASSSYFSDEHNSRSSFNSRESHSELDAVTYDVGTPWYPPVIPLTPAQAAAKKLMQESNMVAYLKAQATNGWPDEQCRLGERYLKGQGVPQDKIIGQMWLQKSANQGNLEASNDLQQLTLTNSVAVQK